MLKTLGSKLGSLSCKSPCNLPPSNFLFSAPIPKRRGFLGFMFSEDSGRAYEMEFHADPIPTAEPSGSGIKVTEYCAERGSSFRPWRIKRCAWQRPSLPSLDARARAALTSNSYHLGHGRVRMINILARGRLGYAGALKGVGFEECQEIKK